MAHSRRTKGPILPLAGCFPPDPCGTRAGSAHVGFGQVVIGGKVVEMTCYDHYLHHKYFECNHTESMIRLEKWFGSFHDGSKELETRMNEHFPARAGRQMVTRNSA
ncbi:hypothetical protein FHT86_006645 [Rhizobium sp. BK313]|uniref:hypothetical protein n=1 Tax=Rhizobium sp. BK313 TaxID=2587081 RepID=UPI001061C864|nr:hypothetical protein [Rhizobium sp. BK313]MBB3458320.1 hypothetical protein [Rhizobium sp. BK313]